MRCEIADPDDYEEAGEHCGFCGSCVQEYYVCCRGSNYGSNGIDVLYEDIRHLERENVTKDSTADTGYDTEEDN